MDITKNIIGIKKNITNSVEIVAATKKRTVQEISEAIAAGITIIGENYVQEAERKYPDLKGKARIHLIGHLQKNKVKRALNIFDCIQTVDSVELAEEIHKHSTHPFPILIQVNMGREKQKHGVMPEQVEELVELISIWKNIKVKGLMCIPPYSEHPEDSRLYFKKMKELFNQLKNKNIRNVEMETLSMGMSHDYKIAIEEGSTMIRLGTIIFGPRT